MQSRRSQLSTRSLIATALTFVVCGQAFGEPAILDPELYLSPREFYELNQKAALDRALLFEDESAICSNESSCCFLNADKKDAQIKQKEKEIADLKAKIETQKKAVSDAKAKLKDFLDNKTQDPGVANLVLLIAAEAEYASLQKQQSDAAMERPLNEAKQRDLRTKANTKGKEVNMLRGLVAKEKVAREKHVVLKNSVDAAERAQAKSEIDLTYLEKDLADLQNSPTCSDEDYANSDLQTDVQVISPETSGTELPVTSIFRGYVIAPE